MTRSVFTFIGLVLLCLGVSSSALAQTSKGFVIGNITDPNDAAITGAVIKITNNTTGISRETVSSEDGGFRLDAVDPGSYRLEVVQSGFKTVTRDHVIVTAAQTTDVHLQLEVGAQMEVVNVTSGADVILQTQDGSRTNTLSKREITDLPVPALNPESIVFTFS